MAKSFIPNYRTSSQVLQYFPAFLPSLKQSPVSPTDLKRTQMSSHSTGSELDQINAFRSELNVFGVHCELRETGETHFSVHLALTGD